MANQVKKLEQIHLNWVLNKIEHSLATLTNSEANTYQDDQEISALMKLRDKPYFARLDFIEANEKSLETIYIGSHTFINDDDFLIYDWRAPISSIYYNGELGKTAYNSPMGKQIVDIKLKRQFEIKQDKIINVYDMSKSIGDQLLLATLSQNSSDKMKNIVATIQADQNQVIRNNQDSIIAVQGIAGSGKTAVLLQRVAWLLYQYRGSVNSQQILIISPTELFSGYINDVLPDLGEPNASQLTFYAIFKKLSWVSECHPQTLNEQFSQKSTTSFLTSYECLLLLTAYCQHLNHDGVCFKSVIKNHHIIISDRVLKKVFYSFNQNYSLYNRFLETQTYAQKQLTRFLKRVKDQKWVEEELANISPQQLASVERQQKFKDISEEQNYWQEKIISTKFADQIEQINAGTFIDIIQLLINFLESLPKTTASQSEIQTAINDLRVRHINGNLSAMLLLIQQYLTHDISDRNIKFLLIDEVQDYTPIQIATLKLLYPNAKFTFLGDANQRIFGNISNIFDDIQSIFDQQSVHLTILNRSYRSSEPITLFTKQLLPKTKFNENVQSVNRNGKTPQLFMAPNPKKQINIIIDILHHNLKKTTAIICKNLTESQNVYNQIHQFIPQSVLVSSEKQTANSNIIIIPVYLAKGLEFDTVIAWDTSDATFNNEQDRFILYTICSRAMHELYLLTSKKESHFLAKISRNLIDRITI
ncbi:RNA polymerase recycling motor HelD [Leuconostoc falkenbergense]|uniref:RNA polymerase recycling motor HelD n=1 Tax=Leuconostoc falkenbergense TaxID=2766470 RepID=UPI0024ADA695|nr:RNA polymerase recycling motor HelD [Leuconostoc falkenbergense]MDI6666728.1 RNA polymerase recycling motor HelD [Leuconostoc falkenbergense]